jgi:hypothetical protein
MSEMAICFGNGDGLVSHSHIISVDVQLKRHNSLPSRAFINEFHGRSKNYPAVSALSTRARFAPPELPSIRSLLTLPVYQASVFACPSSCIRGKAENLPQAILARNRFASLIFSVVIAFLRM